MSDVTAGLSWSIGGHPWLPLLLSVLVVIVVAVGIADVWRRPELTGARAWLLIVARLVSAAMVALLALGPTWSRQRTQSAQGHVAVLVDRSRSMDVESAPGQTRLGQVQALVTRWANEDVPVRWFGFGDAVTPLEPEGVRDATTLQGATAIGRAVTHVAQSFGPDLGAIVVVSDGHETAGSLDAVALRALGVKVHTVVASAGSTLDDDAIVQVNAPPLAMLREPAAIDVVVQAPKRAGQTLPVALRADDTLLHDAQVTLDANGRGEVRLSFVPTRLGRQVLRVEMPVGAQDPLPANNSRALLVRVARERTRVLLVSGRPGWDARYLRGLLNADPAVDLITFFILRTAHDLPMATPQEMSLIPFPTDELFREHLGSFDVVIFQDFEYGPYEMARYLPGIADYVRQGGSFAMVGGSQSFGAGGYATTPIADVLPVAIENGFDVVEGAFRPTLALDAAEHPVVRLSPDLQAHRTLWSRATPMLGLHRLGTPRSNAHVLLTHPSLRTREGALSPVLVVGEAGQGRTLALAVDSSWRWGITNAAATGDGSMYERFWSRALRWLTRDPLLDPSVIETDHERYAPASQVRVTGRIRDGRYAPRSNVPVELSVRDMQDGRVEGQSLTLDHEGRFEAVLRAPRVGAYRVVVSGATGEEWAETAVVVEDGGPELADVSVQAELLAKLSAQTGGTHVASIDEAPSLARFDRARTRSVGTETWAPFKSAWFVLATVLLLAAEWFLRRRAGLR